jgi:hypothetical protein
MKNLGKELREIAENTIKKQEERRRQEEKEDREEYERQLHILAYEIFNACIKKVKTAATEGKTWAYCPSKQYVNKPGLGDGEFLFHAAGQIAAKKLVAHGIHATCHVNRNENRVDIDMDLGKDSS